MNNDSYYKRFIDEEMAIKEKLKKSRASVPEVTEETVMQKVIGQDAYQEHRMQRHIQLIVKKHIRN